MTTATLVIETPTSEGDAIAGRRTVARAMKAGMWLWPSFVVLDAFMCFVAYPNASFSRLLVYRMVVELAFLGVYRASLRGKLELKMLFWLQNMCYSLAALAIAVMAIELGGIHSAYLHGISVVALVRATLVPTHWRQGRNTYARIALAFPVVIAFVAFVSPSARAAWLTAPSLIEFASNYIFVLASSVIGMVTGHIVWSAREQLFRARRVGRYRLQAPIGRGGMGEVWLAWDQSLHRNVALKILRVGDASSPESVRRFELEAQAAGRLRGPHVVQIFDFGASEDGLYFIAMEYLSGMNLANLVDRYGPLPLQRVIHLGIQACLALEEAHSAGVIHRDLKPQNLYLTHSVSEPETLKLLDFGIARLRTPGPERSARLTWTGTMVGTPAFLAPELWRGGEADERSDVYALGVTLHFLLTGTTPFDGMSWGQIQQMHEAASALVLSVPGEDVVDRAFASLLGRCLAREREQRIQTASELHAALAGLHDPEGWTPARAEEFWQLAQRDRFGA